MRKWSVEQQVKKEFGNYLKRARMQSAVTQMEIAEKCGYSNAQFISNIERGTCWPPTPVLVEMSDLYGVPRTELLEKIVFYRKKVWAHEFGLKRSSKLS